MTDNQILRLFGIFYLCIAINNVLNPDYYKRFFESFSNERFGMFLSGMIALIIGYVMIVNHNIWEFSKTVVVTITGWLILLKGVLILAVPDTFTRISSRVVGQKRSIRLYRIMIFVIGLIFLTLSLL
ncbi:MAG: hypothetical protein NC913_01050 [Candidatus Omnitrophica bacterium]|nr:hypothetical protein [Candidatus Omnitrophota bacterium]